MRCDKIILLTFLLVITFTQTQDCTTGVNPNDMIQTGKITAVESAYNGPSRQHSYPVQVNGFAVPAQGFKITASIREYSIGTNRTGGFDFSVGGFQIQGTKNAQIILYINNDNSWISITITYIITSRPDLFLGSFPVQNYRLKKTGTISYEVSHAIIGFTGQNKKITSIGMLSGFRTMATVIPRIRVRSAAISNIGIMTVKLDIQINSPLETVFISFIWWINSPSIKFSAFNPQAGSSVAYQFAGLNQVINTQQRYLGIGFAGSGAVGAINCIGGSCTAKCIKMLDCFTKNGIIANKVCYRCGAGESFQNNDCKKTATQCGTGQILSGTRCICKPAHFWVSTTLCVQCPAKSYWDGRQCICFYNHYNSSNTCVQCPANSVYNAASKTCTCRAPSFLNKGLCITCPIGQIWDAVKKTCGCAAGSTLINGRCQTSCPPNSSPTSSGCQCNQGFQRINGVCVGCPTGAVLIPGSNQCICLGGKHLFNNQCIQCPANSGWDVNQKKCVCLSGFVSVNNACISCPANSRFDGQKCVCNQGYIIQNNQCVRNTVIQCGVNEVKLGVTCVCKESYIKINGVCNCPSNSAPINGICKCNSGFTLTNGVCKANTPPTPGPSTCPNLSAWDGTKCICINGFNFIDGVCKKCQSNSTYDPTAQMCFCNGGYYGSTTRCFACDRTCRFCNGGGANRCTACTNKYKFNKNAGTCTCKVPGNGC